EIVMKTFSMVAFIRRAALLLALSLPNAPLSSAADSPPSARSGHAAVWTGSEMIVWGGTDSNGALNTGGRYDPVTDSWTAITTIGAPCARTGFSTVWTGNEMIVWGGFTNGVLLNDGGRYNPLNNTWTTIPTDGAPSGRFYHRAVWTGSEMIVWSGIGYGPTNI